MWSSLFSPDSAAYHRVRKRVVFITTLSTIALIIHAVAGVVTPLGLSEELAPSFTKPAVFEYLNDTSTFGQGTNSHSGYVFSCLFGYYLFKNCPRASAGVHFFANRMGLYLPSDAYIDTDIPRNISEIYRSDTSGRGNLISGPVDVQYRVFSNSKDSDARNESYQISKNHGNFYTTGVAATLRSVILDDDYVLVEGLIVDAKDGGVGFRNHSAPPNLRYGGTWEKSLLWVEPVSQCIDNNLTVDFTIFADCEIGNLRLTDREGGSILLEICRINIVMTKRIVALFLKVTTNMTSLGKSYAMMKENCSFVYGYETTTIRVGDINRDWVTGDRTEFVAPKNFTAATTDIQCTGDEDKDMSNAGNVAIGCSTIFGTAERTGGGDSARMHHAGSSWSMPIYTCATAIKASVKVATLTVRRTHTLTNLRVDKVLPKNYSSTSVMLVWAVENSGMKIVDAYPFWGVVDPKYKNASHLWTIQCSHLWLPSLHREGSLKMLIPSNSLALFKWQVIGATQHTAASILNLIWTDTVANNLVSTKRLPSAYGITGEDEKPSTGMLAVEMYSKRIRYDLRFGIPAFAILVMWVASLSIALLMLVASPVSLRVVRELINHTSTGRSVTNFLYPETCAQGPSTKIWLRDAGRKKIGIVGLRKENCGGGETVGGESGSMAEEEGEVEEMQREGKGL
ncbi:hypothetical protein HOY80DRAFT_1098254 [Tuber brumale]|nr:hypothetical protein HOY80DRAFT_1098254 [Tuber brumale]